MIIEMLVYQISPPKEIENFIDTDAKVWDPWLKQQPGYINKLVSRSGNRQVILTIFWLSKQDLDKAGSKKEEMARLERAMNERIAGKADLLLSRTF